MRLRLFGQAAQAAGTGGDDIPGTCLDDVLEAARTRYGDQFARVATTCRVWVNGEDPSDAATLGDTDEVALLPPVSGG